MIKKFVILSFFYVQISFTHIVHDKKPWTILIYIAGDNDLESFVDNNLSQMKACGSNEHYNIIVCLGRKEGKKRTKKVSYILIEKNKSTILFETTSSSSTDTGDRNTLYNFCEYAISYFPAEEYGLIFWDHGAGALEPHQTRQTRSLDFSSCLIERHYTTPDYLPVFKINFYETGPHKALCFDDTTSNFLTEKKIVYALKLITVHLLNNKKFGFIGFDMCLMGMAEIASFLHPYAHYMIASQEIELGAGWNYKKVFSIFEEKSAPQAHEIGSHIVEAYKKTYSYTNDLTLSCVDLLQYKEAEKALTQLITCIASLYHHHDPEVVKALLKMSGNKKHCTHFDEPQYIDLIHFLENLLYNIKKSHQFSTHIEHQCELLIAHTISKLQASIIANTAGSYFKRATGLSIYFPHYSVDKIYRKNIFSSITSWDTLLHTCLE